MSHDPPPHEPPSLLPAVIAAIDMEAALERQAVTERLRQARQQLDISERAAETNPTEASKKCIRRLSAQIRDCNTLLGRLRKRASRRRKAARQAHSALCTGESNSGEHADFLGCPRASGPAERPSQEVIDERIAAFRTALGDPDKPLRCCAVCARTVFPDAPGRLLSVSKFLELKGMRESGCCVLESPRMAEKGGGSIRCHDFTGARLRVPFAECVNDDGGREWARRFAEGEQPLHLDATVVQRAGRWKSDHPNYGTFVVRVEAVDATDIPLLIERDYDYIVRRLAGTDKEPDDTEADAVDIAHAVVCKYPDELRRQYDVTVHSETKMLFAKYVNERGLSQWEKKTRRMQMRRLQLQMLAFGGVEAVLVRPVEVHGRLVEHPHLRVCAKCGTSLKNGRLPKFAIANGFAVGWLPRELARLEPTLMEWALAQPAHFYQFLLTYNHRTRKMVPAQAAPGVHGPQAMQGHLHVTKLNAPLVAEALPHSLDRVPVRAVIDRRSSNDVRRGKWTRRLMRVRQKVVRAVLAHGLKHNPHAYGEYRGEGVDDANDAALPEDDDQPGAAVQEAVHVDMNTDTAASGASHSSEEEDDGTDGGGDDDDNGGGDLDGGDQEDVTAAVGVGVAGARGANETRHDTSVLYLSTTMSIEPNDAVAGGPEQAAADMLVSAAGAAESKGDGLAPMVPADDSSGDDDEAMAEDLSSCSSAGSDDEAAAGDSGGVRLAHVRPSSERLAE